MSVKKTIVTIASLFLLIILSAGKAEAAATANCSAEKTSVGNPTCSLKFTVSKSNSTSISTANAGETKGLWLAVSNYATSSHTAYYVCENSGDQVLKVFAGLANQSDTGADWTFAKAGKERCYIVFFPNGVTPKDDWSNSIGSCQTSYVTVSANSAGSSCTTSFSPTSLTAPGTSYLTFKSSNADKMLGSCTGPFPISQGDYGLSYTNYPFPFTAEHNGQTETCTFVPYSGGVAGTACTASVKIGGGSNVCECSLVFSGGPACPSGTKCDGCQCVACTADCSCAANTCVGSNCSDGCGGTCAGTKTGGTCNPTPSANCGTAANSNYACTATQTSGALCKTGITCYPNTGYPPTPCPTNIQFSGTQAHWYCGTDQNCYANKLSSCCTKDCTCASSTCSGSTCSDGCGGKCNGTKSCGSNDKSKYKSLLQFQMDRWTYTNGSWVFKEAMPTGYKNAFPPDKFNSTNGYQTIRPYRIVYSCGDSAQSNGVRCSYSNSAMSLVKVYLLPGSARADVTIFNSQENTPNELDLVAIARFGEPPTGDYSNIDPFDLNRFSRSGAGKLADVTGKDYGVINSDGITSVFEQGFNSNTGLENFQGGWLYIKIIEINASIRSVHYSNEIDENKYKTWYENMTTTNQWLPDGDPPESTTNPTKPVLPTGPDCATKVCSGNSCYNGTKWVAGAKTQDCATGQATANPASLIPPNSSFVTWTSQNAKSMEAACLSGPIIIPRGGWYLNNTECKNSWLVNECTEKGYEFKFTAAHSGTEVFTFYPTNLSDGLPGTPFSVKIAVNGPGACGNNVLENDEECDYKASAGLTNYVPCPQGKTCDNKCKCVIATDVYVCEPKNPTCINYTCQDVTCFDGCNYQQGVMECIGRR